MPDDQFQLDAERHAEFVAFVTFLLGQLVAVEPRFGRQLRTAVAHVVGESRPTVVPIAGKFRPAIALRQLRVAFR